jgi:hypothetical protein
MGEHAHPFSVFLPLLLMLRRPLHHLPARPARYGYSPISLFSLGVRVSLQDRIIQYRHVHCTSTINTSYKIQIHRKKRFTSFPSPAGMSLTKLPLGRNISVMTSLFPPRESLVVTSRLGTVNSRTFFCGVLLYLYMCVYLQHWKIGRLVDC